MSLLTRLNDAQRADVIRELTATVIDPVHVRTMQDAAADSTRAPVQRIVRSVVTREADDRQYLDEDARTIVGLRASRRVVDEFRQELSQATGRPTRLTVRSIDSSIVAARDAEPAASRPKAAR